MLDKYAAYFAFLFVCVIVMYDRMTQFHKSGVAIGLALLLLVCGAFIVRDEPGLFVLVLAAFFQVAGSYALAVKSRAHP